MATFGPLATSGAFALPYPSQRGSLDPPLCTAAVQLYYNHKGTLSAALILQIVLRAMWKKKEQLYSTRRTVHVGKVRHAVIWRRLAVVVYAPDLGSWFSVPAGSPKSIVSWIANIRFGFLPFPHVTAVSTCIRETFAKKEK